MHFKSTYFFRMHWWTHCLMTLLLGMAHTYLIRTALYVPVRRKRPTPSPWQQKTIWRHQLIWQPLKGTNYYKYILKCVFVCIILCTYTCTSVSLFLAPVAVRICDQMACHCSHFLACHFSLCLPSKPQLCLIVFFLFSSSSLSSLL